jgi:hypothetical protein
MRRSFTLFFLIALCSLVAFAQTDAPPPGGFPAVTTEGNTRPETVSDLNAQLVWLMAAAPSSQDSPQESAARKEYQRGALGNLSAQQSESLNGTLRDFRNRHDASAAEYNALVPSMARDDVWVEYRNFRNKVNDLVADTIRRLNDSFPAGSSQFHSTIEDLKSHISVTTYHSSVDANYSSNPRTTVTGFAIFQGTISSNTKGVGYVTAVIVGMVPGCRGKNFPLVILSSNTAPIMGPPTLPWEYINFQYTTPTSKAVGLAGIMVNCEMPD